MTRTACVKAAGQRYQASLRGRLAHAARQRRYRQTKVTHQRSPPQAPNDLLPAIPTALVQSRENTSPLPWHCHFCGQLQTPWVRNDFLRRRIRRPLRNFERRELPHDPTP